MTRENKLALVVGFGLILLVGIVISDHFSPARNQEAARLADPMAMMPASSSVAEVRSFGPADSDAVPEVVPDENFVGMAPGQEPASKRPQLQLVPRRPAPDVPTLEMGLQTQPTTTDPLRANATAHVVRSGENLTSICRRFYGSRGTDLIKDVAAFNGITDLSLIRAGDTIMLPTRGGTTGSAPARSTRSVAATVARSHTVKSGEVLGVISQQYLGTASRYLEIYELNRDSMDSPDTVRQGMVLKIPAR